MKPQRQGWRLQELLEPGLWTQVQGAISAQGAVHLSLLHTAPPTPTPHHGYAEGKQGKESGYEKAGEVLNQTSGAGSEGEGGPGKKASWEETFLSFKSCHYSFPHRKATMLPN